MGLLEKDVHGLCSDVQLIGEIRTHVIASSATMTTQYSFVYFSSLPYCRFTVSELANCKFLCCLVREASSTCLIGEGRQVGGWGN